MNKEELRERVKRVLLENGQPFTMATVSPEGRPHVRWMGGFILKEPLTIYMETAVDSRKVRDIQANGHVELLFARADHSNQLILAGQARMNEDPQVRREVWESLPAAGEYFAGIDDKRLGIIEFSASHAELWVTRDQETPFRLTIED